MKVVIKVASAVIESSDYAMKCARAVAGLREDGHQTILLHNWRVDAAGEIRDDVCDNQVQACQQVFGALSAGAPMLVLIRSNDHYLAASLARLGVPAIDLCGTDAGICRMRKGFAPRHGSAAEVARIDPHWLHIICSNGGVPIISNLAVVGSGEYSLIESDQMAAVLASDWRADALIYLTDVDGVRESNGSVMRWLDLNDMDSLEKQSLITGDMMVKLKRCKEALKRGVGRVRILPAAKVDCLELLFSSRIEFGTEVFIR